jgi:hypothetical protein
MCLIFPCKNIDASASTRINIFEHVAIRARGLTILQDSKQRRILNALQSTSIKVEPKISQIVRSNVATALFSRIIGQRRVILFRIFEKILCAGDPRDLALSVRV